MNYTGWYNIMGHGLGHVIEPPGIQSLDRMYDLGAGRSKEANTPCQFCMATWLKLIYLQLNFVHMYIE
jgi:hypothetical protein